MSDEKPPEKPTVKFEPPPPWMQEAFARVHEGIAAVETRINTRMDDQDEKLDKCVGGLQTLTNEVERHNGELRGLHEWKGGMEERMNNNSVRARSESKRDDDQDMKFQELENRITAAVQADNKSARDELVALVKDAAKTPQGQRLTNALVSFVVVALTLATGYLAVKAGVR